MKGGRGATICLLAFVACKSAPVPQRAVADKAEVETPSSAAACAATASLDTMDTRVAVPLLAAMANHQKQNMRDHLLAVQEIILAAGSEDYAGVERAASRIGFSPRMGLMCTHMGAGAPGFTEQALAFHHTADSISAGARRRDRAAVITALGATLQACTGCHAAFRQRFVDEATWARITSAPTPTRHPSEGAAAP
jgi:hypothetical protein